MIERLSDDLVNQIAAGEVVERPAHLVKELIENSLDAHSTEIEVHLHNGGRDIEIRDNGNGISSRELPLAVERHTTSKIKKINDLWSLSSFGFRGEALASAASVSEMQILSRPEAQNEAASLSVRFGQASSVEKTSRSTGTTIRISNLFENVPARLKFLKTPSTELTQVKQSLKALALAHPNVTFRVRIENELIYFWPATDSQLERVKVVLEENEVFETFAEVGGFQARIFACSPNVTAQQSKKIWTFVKSSWVQDRGMQTAVIEAYRSLLMHGEYPIAVVFLNCPSDEIDVNIHPTKSQVKFRDASLAFRVIHRATRDFLEKAPWRESFLAAPSLSFTEDSSSREGGSVQRESAPIQSSSPTQSYQRPFSSPEFNRTQFHAPIYTQHPSWMATLQNAAEVKAQEPSQESSSGLWASLQVIGQADLTYILTQNHRGLLIVDQHAAHERVLFEKLKKSLAEKSIEVQNYLIPFVVELAENEVEALAPQFENLEKNLGLALDQMGPTAVAVRAAPALVKEESLNSVVAHLAREMAEQGESFALEKALNEVLARMACHSAIRAGRALSFEEMRELLIQMDEFPLSSFCPHGRPVYVEYEFAKLEKEFGRTL